LHTNAHRIRQGTSRFLRAGDFAALDDHHDEFVDGNIAPDQWFFNSLLGS
jgi:hypothetical protein